MSIQSAILNSGLKVRVFADCWDGSIAGHAEAPETGTEWEDVPNALKEAGSHYQKVQMTEVAPDHQILKNLPENCYLNNGHFDDVL